MNRRAVITGIGVVAPSGIGADAHWESTVRGEHRLAEITHFDASPYQSRLGGEVGGFDPVEHVDSRLIVETDRWTQLAVAATTEALADATIEPQALDPYAMAVALASNSGGNVFGQRELQQLWRSPSRTVGAYQSIAWFYAAAVGQLSIRHQMKGPSCVLVSEAAGGLDSLAHAVRRIRRGSDVVLAGGTEAPLGPYALVCQQRSGRLTTRTDPALAYRPFDVDATGYVPGEGGAVLVVEALEHAVRRGAPRIYAEITGWAATHDGRHARRGDAGSEQYARAMTLALDRARLGPAEVDVLFADAQAVPDVDRAEAQAVRAAFGPAAETVPVSAPKPLIGRLYQGGSALDVATAVLAMRSGCLPAVAGLEQPAPGCELNFVRAPRPATIDVAMVNARGFDGFNSSLMLRRWAGLPERPGNPGGPGHA